MALLVVTHVESTFSLKNCLDALGLQDDPNGRIVRKLLSEIKEQAGPYVPMDKGSLKEGARIDGTDLVYGGAGNKYAHYVWEGIVYEDPQLHCAGFITPNGWKSRKNVDKVPSERRLEYGNGNLRGDHWVERMLQDGGRKRIESEIRKEIGR